MPARVQAATRAFSPDPLGTTLIREHEVVGMTGWGAAAIAKGFSLPDCA